MIVMICPSRTAERCGDFLSFFLQEKCIKSDFSGSCQEHGIFRTFSLLFFTICCLRYPLHILFLQFHSSKRQDNTRAIDPKT